MYSISAYGRMITDSQRMAAYAEALRRSVTPDSVVLDIGTGTGILAILACRFGARRVFAIEPSEVITVARETAAANGFANRIDFFQDRSNRVDLTEKATILVSDLRGVLPLHRDHLPTIIDARHRLLTPGATLIPQRDTLWAAIVESPELYRRYIEPWDKNEFELDLRPAKKLVLNTWREGRAGPDRLLSDAHCWGELNYLEISSPDIHGTVTYDVKRTGLGHGLIVWFDACLTSEIGFSSGPFTSELIYGSAFFPWLEPVDLEVGDKVTVTIRADLVGEEYVWRWNTRVQSDHNASHLKADFKQSTFFGDALSTGRLRKSSATYIPQLNNDGRVAKLILTMMNGKASQKEIAEKVILQFPDQFSGWEDALNLVSKTSLKYCQ
jgi:type I protein arginine methyltransferase